jgi:hypothetical protein
VLLLGFSTVRNLALGVKVWDTLGTGVSRRELEALGRTPCRSPPRRASSRASSAR